VRGYASQSDDHCVDTGDIALQQAALAALAQQRQELAQELAGYLAAASAAEAAGKLQDAGGALAAVARREARVDGAIGINKATLACELTLTTGDEDSVIKVERRGPAGLRRCRRAAGAGHAGTDYL
jgi:hypothetical protein